MKFCGSCGTPVELPAVPAETVTFTEPASALTVTPVSATPVGKPADSILQKAKKFGKLAIIAVIVIIAAGAAWNFLKPSKYEQTKATLTIQQVDDIIVVKVNGKRLANIEGYLSGSSRSLDNAKAVILVAEEQGSYANLDGYSLYWHTGKMITDGVFGAQISLSGDGVAFIKDADYSSSPPVGELCLYVDGKTTTITSGYNLNNNFVLSPDGKIVAYTVADDDKTVAYYYDGKARELGKDMYPVAIANGAKYVYYNKNDNFCVQIGASGDKKETLGKNVNSIFFNNDLSQVVYTASTDNGQKAYISKNGGAKSGLRGIVGNFIMPYGTTARVPLVPVASFADTFYTDGSAVYYINGKFEVTSVVNNVSSSYLANNGKTLTYMKSGSIYQVDGKSDKADKVELVDGDVSMFVATDDGKAVFFVNDNGEVYYQKGRSKPVMVGDDFTIGYRSGSGLSLFQGKTLFYISDDEICSSSGGKGVSVKGLDGYIQYVSAGMLDVTISTNDGGETLTYYSTDGKNFALSD